MRAQARADERYTICRRIFKFLGAGFYIYDTENNVVGYCKQKAFRLKEDLRIYTDDACAQELLVIRTPSVLDFGATYTVTLPDDGAALGAFKRRGVKSMLRDSWQVTSADGAAIAEIVEDSGLKALVRRVIGGLAWLVPQTLHMRRVGDEAEIASYRTHANPFMHRLGVRVHEQDESLDDLMILAGGVLLSAIEGRQSG